MGVGRVNPNGALLLPCLLARFMDFGSSWCLSGPGSGQAGVLGCLMAGLPAQQSCGSSLSSGEDPHKTHTKLSKMVKTKLKEVKSQGM